MSERRIDLMRWRRELQRTPKGRHVLGSLATVYGFIIGARDWMYRLRLLPSKRLGARTVCIGNLTTGGTGKTSAVLLAARTLHAKGMKTAILSRGYSRSKKAGAVTVLSPMSGGLSWKETGDEPWMLHRALNGLNIPIVVSANRAHAGKAALDLFHPDVLLLDDGFQHRSLRKDMSVILINARDPFGGGSLLPLGNLREPLSALRRANLAVVTHADEVPRERLEEIESALWSAHARLPVAQAVYRAEAVIDLKTQARQSLPILSGKQVAALSAIGDPESFEDQLRGLGANVEQAWRYPDHHAYSVEDLRSIEKLRGDAVIVTTLKDFPRLSEGWREILAGEVLALSVAMEITEGKALWEEALCGR